MADVVLVGGAGFLGRLAARQLLDRGHRVHVIDRRPPRPDLRHEVAFHRVDLLVDDVRGVLSGHEPGTPVVVMIGHHDAGRAHPWTMALDNVFPVARLCTALVGRRVLLLSSADVWGTAPAPLTERSAPGLPWSTEDLEGWLTTVRTLSALGPCPPHRVASACRQLSDADPTGRWLHALTKRAQELLLTAAVGEERLVVLRLAGVVGPGGDGVVGRLVRRAVVGRPMTVADGAAGSFLPVDGIGDLLTTDLEPGAYDVGAPPVAHEGTLFDPPLPVVVPGRPDRPDEVADRQAEALWTGAVKSGNRWSRTLTDELACELDLPGDRRLLLTTSGTDALRIGVGAVAGRAAPGAVALLPSFTFPATAEVLVQLGYRLRFVDVDQATWTLDPPALRHALEAEPSARLVVAVDTFGHPCRYPALQAVCDAHGVALVADSAASLGARAGGRPIGSQAGAHAFSMSFAKTLSAGGAGGAVTLPAAVALDDPHGWTRSALMNELHAVVALDQLRVLRRMVGRRSTAAERYRTACSDAGFGCQATAPGASPSWTHFVLRVPGGTLRRAMMADELARLGVGTKPYFEPLHRHGFGALDPGCAERLPVTEQLGQEVLAIPMSGELTDHQVERVTVALARAVATVDARSVPSARIAERARG